MRIVIIQGFSLMGLVLILGVVSISAQLSTQYRAEIPFDFSARGVKLTAGLYTVAPMSSNSSGTALQLRNRETGKSTILGVVQTSGDGSIANGKMYFENIEGRWILSEINTPSFEKRLKRTRTDVHIVKSEPSKLKVLAVNLIR